MTFSVDMVVGDDVVVSIEVSVLKLSVDKVLGDDVVVSIEVSVLKPSVDVTAIVVVYILSVVTDDSSQYFPKSVQSF